MRSLCLLLVVALASALTVQEYNTHAVSTVRGIKRHLSPSQRLATTGHQLQGQAECAAAITVATTLLQTCQVFDIFENSTNFSYDQMNTIIGAHCAADPLSCSSQLESAIANVTVQCIAVLEADPTLWLNIGFLFVINRVPCLNHDSKWCFAEFQKFGDRLDTMETDPLTADDLMQGCTECTQDVVVAWIAFEPTWKPIYVAQSLALICSQIDGKWCYLEFMKAIDALDGASDGELITLAPTYCVPCTFSYLFQWRTLIDLANGDGSLANEASQTDRLIGFIGWLCVRDPSGHFCNAKLTSYNFDAVGAACDGSATAGPSGGPACTSSCKSAVQKVVRDLGCCLDTWLDLLTWSCLQPDADASCQDPAQSPANIRILVSVLCGVTIPDGCGRNRALEAALIIRNLRIKWCQDNADACLAIIRAAVAQQFQLDLSDMGDISMDNVTRVEAPPQRRRLLQTDDGDVAVSVTLKNKVGSVDASLTSSQVVVGVNGAARSDPTQPTTTEVLSAEVKDSSAAAVAPAVSLALLGLVLLML